MQKPQFRSLLRNTTKCLITLSIILFAACSHSNKDKDEDDDYDDDSVTEIRRKPKDDSFNNDKATNTPSGTYTCSQFAKYKNYVIASQFTFLSPTEVLWSVSTPNGFYIPIGYGTYNSTEDNIVFKAGEKLHTAYIMKNGDVTFNFKIVRNSAKACVINNIDAESLINDGQDLEFEKDKTPIILNNGLAGTRWRSPEEGFEVEFVSEREVKIDGESMPYMYTDTKLGISTGDNPFDDEGCVGTVLPNDKEMTLWREGAIESLRNSFTVSLIRVN